MSWTLRFTRRGRPAEERFETREAAIAFAADGFAAGLLHDGRLIGPRDGEGLDEACLRAAAGRHRAALEAARAATRAGDPADGPRRRR